VTTTALSLTPTIQQIAITDLKPAEWNARKSFDESALENLVASILEHGVQVPLLVRPIQVDCMDRHAIACVEGDQHDAYEIVAGHRRYKAALRVTDVDELPCIVRHLSDDQARVLGLVDNLQREGVPAMEEAQMFSELLSRLGSIEQVAARVQKEQSYVARRLKLCTLTAACQTALAGNVIWIDHAMVLAPLGADEQNQMLKWALDHNAGVKVSVDQVVADRVKLHAQQVAAQSEPGKKRDRWRNTWEPASVQELKDHIASISGIVLSRSPFSLDDEELAGAAACNVCPQNTRANVPLFADLAIGAATCTDGACFRRKVDAFVQIQAAAELERSDWRPLRVSWKSTTTPPRMEKCESGNGAVTPKDDQTFKAGQWVEAKRKSCEHVRGAVAVDWSDADNRGFMGDSDRKLRKPGEILQVCIEPKCKAHGKAYNRPQRSSSGSGHDPAAEEAKREKLEAAAREETRIRVAVASKAIEGVKGIPAEAIRAIAIDKAPTWPERTKVLDAVLPGWRKTLQTARVDSVEFARALALVSISDLRADVYNDLAQCRRDFLASVKRIGFDGSDAFKQAATERAAATKAANKADKKPAKKAAKKVAKKAARKGGRK
jgi:ParB/RepB/Spo0J family partition protein